MKLSKKDIKDLESRGIVPGARVRSAYENFTFTVAPWSIYEKLDDGIITSSSFGEKVTSPMGLDYFNMHWLKFRDHYATVIKPSHIGTWDQGPSSPEAIYEIKLQRTKSKKTCICLVSAKNGKLVMKGEPLNRVSDARKVANSIREAMGMPEDVIETLPWNHRWPKNSGPKKAKKG